MSRKQSSPTIPVPPEPSIPHDAPESAYVAALHLDTLTGGDGRWMSRREAAPAPYETFQTGVDLGWLDADCFGPEPQEIDD